MFANLATEGDEREARNAVQRDAAMSCGQKEGQA